MHIMAFDGSVVAWIALLVIVALSYTLVSHGLRLGAHALIGIGAIGLAAASLWAQGASAQDTQNLAGFVRGIEDRGRSAEDALRSWVEEVNQRQPGYAAEARDLSDANRQRLRDGLGMVDGELGQAAQDFATEPARDGAVYVAVSLSMPPQSLRQLAIDAQAMGAQVVIRGLVDNSLTKTMTLIKSSFDDKTAAGIAIDPNVFRSFGVSAVPTFIVARSPVEPCPGIDCVTAAPAFDRVVGNVSLREALRQVAGQGDAAPDIARLALTRGGA